MKKQSKNKNAKTFKKVLTLFPNRDIIYISDEEIELKKLLKKFKKDLTSISKCDIIVIGKGLIRTIGISQGDQIWQK